MCYKRKECIQSLFRSIFVNCENGTQYFVNNKFLIPGKHYFNEASADKNIIIPIKRSKGKKVNSQVVNQLFDNPFSIEEGEQESKTVTNEEIDDQWYDVC